MATGIRNYSVTANDNTDLAGVDVDEGMAMNLLNNALRAMQAELKKFVNDISGKLVSGGSANAQTLTSESALTAYSDGCHFSFIAGFANTGATTLSVNAIGAKKVLKGGGTALANGDIALGMLCHVSYDASADAANGAWMLAVVDTSSILSAAGTATFTNKTFDANGTGNVLSNVEVADFAASAIVTEAEGIGSNDNDTTIPTSAAVKDYVTGQQTIWVPAGAMVPRTTNGAASGSFETSTNDVMLSYLAFDATTKEGAQFNVQMPKGWDEGTVVAQFVWTHPSTVTNFGVSWELAAVAFATDDAADTAFGTLQEIDDTGGTTHDIYISDETPAITVAGSPGAEEWVVFQVTRDPADAGDTMAVDAWLLGVKVHYTTNAAKDD